MCSKLGFVLGFLDLGRFVGANVGLREGLGITNDGAVELIIDGSSDK